MVGHKGIFLIIHIAHLIVQCLPHRSNEQIVLTVLFFQFMDIIIRCYMYFIIEHTLPILYTVILRIPVTQQLFSRSIFST